MTTTETQSPKNGTTMQAPPLAVLSVPFKDIVVDEGFNNRLHYDGIKELAANIKSVGLLNPLTVRKKSDGKYHIVAGHRRYYAIESFEKPDFEVLVHVKEYDREDLAIFDMLSEGNRVDASNYELALVCKKLEDKYATRRDHIAKMTGRSQGEISQLISCVTDLSSSVRKAWEASITPNATTDTVAQAADIALENKSEVKMTALTNRKSGEIPLSRLVKWKKLDTTGAQKKYLEAYLDGDRAVETKESKATNGAAETKGAESQSEDSYVPPTKKQIRDAIQLLDEKKKEDGKLSDEDIGRHKALRWVIGKLSRMT